MIPVVSVVGSSNAGKTTLVVKLLAELKLRGYKVATVKHDVHGFDIDVPGKDTWRHAQAGADTVILSSPLKIATIRNVEQEVSLDDIIAGVSGVDLILTEGYKRANKPKIEVFRAETCRELVSKPEELIAVATDCNLTLDVPCYDLDDACGLIDRIEQLFLCRHQY